jgi:DNA-binding MarR family transcriptional regulator
VDLPKRNGLVFRSAAPGDRRTLHVSLTESGWRAAHAFHAEATNQLNLLHAFLASGRA